MSGCRPCPAPRGRHTQGCGPPSPARGSPVTSHATVTAPRSLGCPLGTRPAPITEGLRGDMSGLQGTGGVHSAGLEAGGGQGLSRDHNEARTSRSEGGLGEKEELREGQGRRDGTEGLGIRGSWSFPLGELELRWLWAEGGLGGRRSAPGSPKLGDRTRDTTQGTDSGMNLPVFRYGRPPRASLGENKTNTWLFTRAWLVCGTRAGTHRVVFSRGIDTCREVKIPTVCTLHCSGSGLGAAPCRNTGAQGPGTQRAARGRGRARGGQLALAHRSAPWP